MSFQECAGAKRGRLVRPVNRAGKLARLLRLFPSPSIVIQLPETIYDTTGRFEGSQ